jgi:hypothetical protein
MRRLALTLLLAASPAAALAATLGVPLNQSAVLAMPGQIRDVVVGNPAIADAAVADPRHVIVTGKIVGVTNLIVRDAGGRVIFDRQVVVGAATDNRVALIEGPSAGGARPKITNYACAPECETTGDQSSQAGPGPGGGGPISVTVTAGGAPAAAPGATP